MPGDLQKDVGMCTRLGLASLAVLIGAATPAYADPGGDASGPDATFLASLQQQGVSYKSGAAAISVGRKACELMDQGHSKSQVIQSLSADNPGFSPESAEKFATSAVSVYCPQHNGEPNTAPPTPLPPAQQPIVDFPVITPGAP
jgi:hypothetical protein